MSAAVVTAVKKLPRLTDAQVARIVALLSRWSR